jgi:hypothetical protein
MSVNQNEKSSILVQALKGNWELELLQEKLSLDGHDQISIDLLLREFKKMRNAKRQQIGFVYLGVGAFIGFMSCLLTILNPFPDYFNLILYGLTSVAVTIAFVGLYYIFE